MSDNRNLGRIANIDTKGSAEPITADNPIFHFHQLSEACKNCHKPSCKGCEYKPVEGGEG